jgi:hypothetical protein
VLVWVGWTFGRHLAVRTRKTRERGMWSGTRKAHDAKARTSAAVKEARMSATYLYDQAIYAHASLVAMASGVIPSEPSAHGG